jgi:hypothetical protein
MNYHEKYLKYKNKYLRLLSTLQIGGDKALITDINSINLFTDPDMEEHLNPIYGLYMCASGFISNNFFLRQAKIINTPESKLITNISRKIPGSIQPTKKIMDIEPIDFGRYIALKYIFFT